MATKRTPICGAKKSDVDNYYLHVCTKLKGHTGRHYCGECWTAFLRRTFWSNKKKRGE